VWLAELTGGAKLLDKACEGSDPVGHLFGVVLNAQDVRYAAVEVRGARLRSFGLTSGVYGDAALPTDTINLSGDGRRLLIQQSKPGRRGRSVYDLLRVPVPALSPSQPTASRSPAGPAIGTEVDTYAG